MPLDTSIPLQFNQAAPAQAINPMTIYQLMQDRQSNALRAQMYQQEMAKNAMIMQNTAEDRRIAAAGRAEAARAAAETRANAAYLTNAIRGGYNPAKEAVMGPGTVQGSTPASFNEDRVLNALYAKGNPALLTAYSNMQEQFGKQREAEAKATGQGLTNTKTQAETLGVLTENQKKKIDLADAQIKQLSTIIGGALTPDAVYAAYAVAPDALALKGQTPDSAIKMFNQKVAEVGFDRARMEVERGVYDTAKQLSEEIKMLDTPQGQAVFTPRTGETKYLTTPDGQRVMPMDKRSVTNIDMKGEGAFAGELGKLEAKSVVEGRGAAEDARSIIETVNAGRRLLDKGVITGVGANAKLAFAKGLQQIGVTSADGSIESTEAYMSNMAQNVGKLIKQFGAGTGLSDTDRAYAEKMAAGDISFNESSLRKILTMSEQAARNVISKHNARVKDVKSQTGLTVDEPIRYFTHPDEVKAAKLPSGTHIMTPEGEKVVP